MHWKSCLVLLLPLAVAISATGVTLENVAIEGTGEGLASDKIGADQAALGASGGPEEMKETVHGMFAAGAAVLEEGVTRQAAQANEVFASMHKYCSICKVAKLRAKVANLTVHVQQCLGTEVDDKGESICAAREKTKEKLERKLGSSTTKLAVMESELKSAGIDIDQMVSVLRAHPVQSATEDAATPSGLKAWESTVRAGLSNALAHVAETLQHANGGSGATAGQAVEVAMALVAGLEHQLLLQRATLAQLLANANERTPASQEA